MATVVIVEDEDLLRETLRRYLVHVGHEVIPAASGAEALEAVIDRAPDVLVADWMLKDHVHGLHVSEVFRALHPRLNTILITGFPSRDLLEESDRCGVVRLLEKPFDLEELDAAIQLALASEAGPRDPAPPIAAMALDLEGAIQFSSARAVDLMVRAELPPDVSRIDEIVDGDPVTLLSRAERDWVEIEPRGAVEQSWLLRTRRRPGRSGWLAVLCARGEAQRRADPRLRMLLEMRESTPESCLADHGPIVVVEREGVVRRLLVSQIDRLGALCYPCDDFDNALRLLGAEPRVQTVLIDFTLAGHEMRGWVDRIRAIRPAAKIIGTGGIGAESDLLAQGVSHVLRKPWRIDDLVEAIDEKAGTI